jgi:hypothetical protein
MIRRAVERGTYKYVLPKYKFDPLIKAANPKRMVMVEDVVHMERVNGITKMMTNAGIDYYTILAFVKKMESTILEAEGNATQKFFEACAKGDTSHVHHVLDYFGCSNESWVNTTKCIDIAIENWRYEFVIRLSKYPCQHHIPNILAYVIDNNHPRFAEQILLKSDPFTSYGYLCHDAMRALANQNHNPQFTRTTEIALEIAERFQGVWLGDYSCFKKYDHQEFVIDSTISEPLRMMR